LLEVEGRNYLGIYLSKDTATVVCLDSQSRGRKVLACFSISVEEQQMPDRPGADRVSAGLVNLIAQGCAERIQTYQDCEVAVALDCAMFMQHKVHSEFNDIKQIGQTIRFDTEEALATNISSFAMAFKIASSKQTGSELTVFTAQRKMLSEVIGSLQSNNIDPVTIEPDVNCLSRFIWENVSLPESEQVRTLFGILSCRSGYFIVPILSGAQKTSAMRTFLVSSTQDRSKLLAREVPVTTALLESGEPINCIKVFDSASSVNVQTLGEKLGIEAGFVDLAPAAGLDAEALADCTDTVDFAIAYGAALAHSEKAQSINFRNDFMPYQGKKARLQKALKFASCSVVVLVLAVGLYFQLQLSQTNKYRSRLRNKFEKQYSAVMLGKKPPAKSNPTKKLAGELRRIRDVKSGQLSVTGTESVSAKLTLLLEAFNKCAAQTKLQIDSISITAKNISIAGSTSSRKNTLKLFEAINKGKLQILQQNLDSKGGRDNFRISVMPRK
jgi:hypothetical protein